jgi:DNA-binding MarR family transcriptional regulator
MGFGTNEQSLAEQPQIQKVIDSFWDTLVPAWNQVRKHVRELALESSDISLEQFHILRHVRKGIVSVSDLAQERQISRSAVSQIVDTLVGKGYLTRQENPQDRRFIDLALTPIGSQIIQSVFEQNRAWMARKLATLNPEELEAITLGMEALQKAFPPKATEEKEPASFLTK